MNSKVGILTKPSPQICSSASDAEAGHVKHMADAGGCKYGDDGAVKNQLLHSLGYMRVDIEHAVDDALRAIQFLKEPLSLAFIETLALWLSACFQSGNKLLIAGNGGSLCDAMHCAEELTGIFRKKRRALPAIALSDPGHLSCVGNDLGYQEVFSRAIEALGRPGDLFIALTTSGNSQNLCMAVARAKEMGLKTVAFLGKTGGELKGAADLEWIVPNFCYSDRIQEAHMAAIHITIEMVEKTLLSTQLVNC